MLFYFVKFFEGFFNGLNRGITCLHEPSPDLFNLAIAKIREDIDSKSVRDKLFHSRKHLILENENKNLYIESNPFIFPLLDDIKHKFTKTKFVFIVRDPKTYLTSAYNKQTGAEDEVLFYGIKDSRNRISALDTENDSEFENWNEFSKFKFCYDAIIKNCH